MELRQAYEVGVFAIQKVFSSFPQKMRSLFVLILVLSFFPGCHYTEGPSTTLAPEGKTVLNRLVVLPFEEKIPKDDATKIVTCPLCGAVFHTEKDPLPENVSLGNIFLDGLRGYKQFTIVAPENSAEVYRRLSLSVEAPLADILKLVGTELKADGVLIGYVFRYRERKGYPYSVEKPASIAFDVHLLRVKDGLIVWRGVFDKAQRSLMENLFQLSSFKRYGIKWITAHELAEEGIDELLKTFPGIK